MDTIHHSILTRFWSRVHKTETCWLWTGGFDSHGYGMLCIYKYRAALHLTTKSIRAHRLSYLIHCGPIPDKLHVLHQCDVPACVNPAHLFLGTQQDNMRDMVKKNRHSTALHPENIRRGEAHWVHFHPDRIPRGDRSGARRHPETLARGERHGSRVHPERIPRGEAHYEARVTVEQVRDIRQRYKAAEGRKGLLTELAKEFGMSCTAIRYIIQRRNWKSVEDVDER